MSEDLDVYSKAGFEVVDLDDEEEFPQPCEELIAKVRDCMRVERELVILRHEGLSLEACALYQEARLDQSRELGPRIRHAVWTAARRDRLTPRHVLRLSRRLLLECEIP